MNGSAPPPGKPGRPSGSSEVATGAEEAAPLNQRTLALNSIAEDIVSVHEGLYDCSVEVLQEVQRLTSHAAVLVGNSLRANRLAVQEAAGAEGSLSGGRSPRSVQVAFSDCPGPTEIGSLSPLSDLAPPASAREPSVSPRPAAWLRPGRDRVSLKRRRDVAEDGDREAKVRASINPESRHESHQREGGGSEAGGKAK